MLDEHSLGKLLGTGMRADVHELGDAAVKLYKAGTGKSAAFREAAVLAAIEAAGLSAPRVQGVQMFGGRWGVAMDRVDGASFAHVMQRDPGTMQERFRAMARHHHEIHAVTVDLPARQYERLIANIKGAAGLDASLRERLMTRLGQLPEGRQVCHGDFHPFNVMGTLDAPVVIDWVDASLGMPAADVCRSYVLMSSVSEDLALEYVDAYTALGDLTRDDILSWRPIIAAARLSEGVPAETERLMAWAGLV